MVDVSDFSDHIQLAQVTVISVKRSSFMVTQKNGLHYKFHKCLVIHRFTKKYVKVGNCP